MYNIHVYSRADAVSELCPVQSSTVNTMSANAFWPIERWMSRLNLVLKFDNRSHRCDISWQSPWQPHLWSTILVISRGRFAQQPEFTAEVEVGTEMHHTRIRPDGIRGMLACILELWAFPQNYETCDVIFVVFTANWPESIYVRASEVNANDFPCRRTVWYTPYSIRHSSLWGVGMRSGPIITWCLIRTSRYAPSGSIAMEFTWGPNSVGRAWAFSGLHPTPTDHSGNITCPYNTYMEWRLCCFISLSGKSLFFKKGVTVGEKSENHQDMILIVEAQHTAQTMALLPQVFSQSVSMYMQPLCTYILLHCKMWPAWIKPSIHLCG